MEPDNSLRALPAPLSTQTWRGAQSSRRRPDWYSCNRLSPLQLPAQGSTWLMGPARTGGILSREPNSIGDFPQPLHPALGRDDGGHSLLGAEGRGGAVSGLRHQLHSSGLPCAVVSGVTSIYVPMPRRGVL